MQWVKRPLLGGRIRAAGEYPCVDVWKVRGLSRLPAHLCASALLGKIIFTAVPADNQQEETDTTELPELRQTGEVYSTVALHVQWKITLKLIN